MTFSPADPSQIKPPKRKVDLVVLSDIHLGTYGCNAKELCKYLKSIEPNTLILNGDIIDIWQFSKRYWPREHMKVVKHILNMSANGTKVYYLTGNHDETLRKFEGLEMGNFQILNKLQLDLNGEKVLFFHGDVFDVTMQYSKWLAKIGAISYDALILLNVVVNKISKFFGGKKFSLSKTIKDNVKSAVKFVNNFEMSAALMAMNIGVDTVVCGHIHQPQDKIVNSLEGKSVRYLNSGDWIENLTSLEYHEKKWKIYSYNTDLHMSQDSPEFETNLTLADLDNKAIFELMLADFKN